MKRFILTAAVLVVAGGMFAGSAEARGSRGFSHGARGFARGGYHAGYHWNFRTFPHTYYGWNRVWYNPRYRCNWYFDSGCNSWFYYYAPQQTYLPVSQIATYPPTISIVNNNTNSIGSPGAVVPVPGPAVPVPGPAVPAPSPGAMPPAGMAPIPGPGSN